MRTSIQFYQKAQPAENTNALRIHLRRMAGNPSLKLYPSSFGTVHLAALKMQFSSN